MKTSSPSFIEIELTTPLPCRQRRPASITVHFDESTMTGTRAMSGSAAIRLQVLRHRRFGIDQALVHVDVEDLRAVRDLLARDFDGLVVAVVLDQLLELRRTGHVRALADVDEQQLRRDDQRLEAGEAGVARYV